MTKLWCAYCFRDITDHEYENHHMISRAKLSQLVDDQVESWTVPVHKGECHQELQWYSNSATLALVDSARSPLPDVERRCRDLFYDGDLGRGVYLSAAILKKIPPHKPDDRQRVMKLQANCVSGSMLAPELITGGTRAAIRWQERTKAALDGPQHDFVLADVLVTAGYFERAETILRHYEETPGRQRDKNRGILLRRSTILRGRASHGEEARRRAEGEGHRYDWGTATIALGWCHIKNQEYVKARDCFMEAIFDSTSHERRVSFWHLASAEFGLGCASLLGESSAQHLRAIELLYKAQHTCDLLGLAYRPVPDLLVPGLPLNEKGAGVPPVRLIECIADKYELSDLALEEVRLRCLPGRSSDLLTRLSRASL